MYFNAEEFGKRMQKVRCENHLTQEQLADLLNISRIHVARIERGEIGRASCRERV